MMEVKRLQESDLEWVNFIVKNLIDEPVQKDYPAHLNKLLKDANTYIFAAFVDGNVVGFALAYKFLSLYSPDYLAYLYDIGVVDEHKRKGIGTQLIETLKSALQKDGVSELWLGTGTQNKEGQGLFSATGAERSDEDFNDFTYYLD